MQSHRRVGVARLSVCRLSFSHRGDHVIACGRLISLADDLRLGDMVT